MDKARKNKTTRILMMIPSMGSGGAERVFATLANELSIRGYEINIITLTSSVCFYRLLPDVKIISAGYEINRKNKLTTFYSMSINGIRSLNFIRKQIKKCNPDIILSFLTHTNILALITHIFNRNLPIIISERNDPRQRNIIVQLITKYSYPLADYLVCQSEKVVEFFPKKTQKNIKIIPNPINLDSIVLHSPEKRRKAIVAIGRLFPQKNFSLLINSFNDIKEEFPNYTLEIFGEGFLREKLQKQIDELNLNNRVFLMGVKKNVMEYVYDAELFVMSSNFEGFPNALVEAMASGLPVISTNFSTGVAKELIKEENGLVVPVGDQKELSNAIRKILSDKMLRKKMSSNNRKIINMLSTKKIIEKWIQLFEEIK